MKNISSFIKEAFSTYRISSTPDKLQYRNKTFMWFEKSAVPFICNKETNCFLFGNIKGTHYQILEETDTDILSEFGIDTDFLDISSYRYTDDCSYDEFLVYNKERLAKFNLGRIWREEKVFKRKNITQYTFYIAWWNELSSEEFNRLNKNLIKEYMDFYELDGEISKVYVVDNNGKVLIFENNKKKEIEKTSDDYRIILKNAAAIHLASQKEKKNFFKEFIKNRDEYNQKKYYNHTKSKTEAEYRSIKYQESLSN